MLYDSFNSDEDRVLFPLPDMPRMIMSFLSLVVVVPSLLLLLFVVLVI